MLCNCTGGGRRKMSRENNVEVFQDTINMCKTHHRLKESIVASNMGQQLILEYEELENQIKRRFDNDAKVIVSKKRTFEAAMCYEGKVCVLNFASATTPGGGVVKGSNAQEEALCRCSTLYPCIDQREMWSGFYYPHRSARNPIHNDDCIYTPDVVVFKSDTENPSLLNETAWKKVDVISCASPNLRPRPENSMNMGDGTVAVKLTDEELKAIHEVKLRRIFDIALAKGVEVMILGAYGCGAFQNPPAVVARAMCNVVKEYIKEFKTIEFAIYCSIRETINYDEFVKVMIDII